jgi:ketosteroid isomerase-like protein
MRKYLAAASVVVGIGLTTSPSAAQVVSATGQRAIADTVTQLFSGIAAATNSLDLDRLLGYYEATEELTYVARSRVTRGYAAFTRLVHDQFGGLRGADLTFRDTYVDVLSDEVAVATATFQFTASFPDGGSGQSTGVYICIFVRTEGGWKVRYSAHTFPQTSG